MRKTTVLVALAVAATAACSSSQGSNDGAADSAGGAGGSGSAGAGGSASGNGGTGGRTVSCSPYTSNIGCLCSSSGSGTLSECSPASVSMGDQGVCCDDSLLCSCYRIACINLQNNTLLCNCGVVAPDSSGTRVTQCSKPANGVCCFANSSEPFRCRCSDIDTTCLAGETEVQSCSLADVMKCSSTSTMPDRCK